MIWQLEKTTASFNYGDYRGELEISAPQNGITIHQSNNSRSTAGLLGVTFADSDRVRLQDCYPRVDDLIAIYPQTSARPFNVQLQYRVFGGGEQDSTLPEASAPDLLLVEQWISNYTFSLDTHPQLDVDLFPIYRDSVDAIQVWQDIDGDFVPLATGESDGANIAAVVTQPAAGRPAIAAIVHPRDQSDADFAVQQAPEGSDAFGVTMLRLFDRFMEKGVIRRARLRLIISPNEIDDDLLLKHYEHFVASPLPLTT